MKQNNSRKENENNFDTWVNIHKPHFAFMKFCGFGSNENITILYRNYSCVTFKRYLIISYQLLN
jgi:hypothetical protein